MVGRLHRTRKAREIEKCRIPLQLVKEHPSSSSSLWIHKPRICRFGIWITRAQRSSAFLSGALFFQRNREIVIKDPCLSLCAPQLSSKISIFVVGSFESIRSVVLILSSILVYLSESDHVLSFFCLRKKIMRNSFFIPSLVNSCCERNVILYWYYVLRFTEIFCTITIFSTRFRSRISSFWEYSFIILPKY